MATIIDGKAIAALVKQDLQARIARLQEHGVRPGLAVVLVGDDPASIIYVTQKEKTAQALGMHSVLHRLPATVTQAELEELVDRLNADPLIHGILVQSPLPAGLNEEAIFQRVSPEKDVDGFHEINVGRLWAGHDGLFPCTPLGVIEILDRMGVQIEGKRAVVVGRSNIVGKPMAGLLLRRNATVTIAHSKTPDLKAITREAEILIVAIGKLQYLDASYIRPGAVVIDVGINPVPGYKSRIRGDVDFDSAAQVAGMITPVPGGVGPMTIAMLMANVVKAAERIHGVAPWTA
jgi:methylenetetrahydrofolate dehydrogenase (NADP+)/methenyltetrahydrofolate cyclohydrolase